MATTPWHARFDSRVSAVPPALAARMLGASFHPEDARCPPLAALRLVSLSHWDFAGAMRTGELVVAATVADELVEIFAGLFGIGFPIAGMEPIDAFGGDDDASMAANNTSAFNFRNVAGTGVLSKHAYGIAIDINPLQNPMIKDGVISPPAGADYVDRSFMRPGMITRPGPVVDLFDARGWDWGGDWSPMKDYHHFTRR